MASRLPPPPPAVFVRFEDRSGEELWLRRESIVAIREIGGESAATIFVQCAGGFEVKGSTADVGNILKAAA